MRGGRAGFVCFSGEDSGQTRDAIGEPRIPRRSWSRHLSNAPGLAGQLAASRKDSAREDFDVLGTVGKLALPTFARFRICKNPSSGLRDKVPRTGVAGVFLVRLRTVFRSGFRLDPLPISDFDDLGIVGKLVLPTFQRYRPCTEASLGGGQFDSAFGQAVLRGFSGIVGPSRTRNGLVNARSNLVKLREMCPGPSSWGYLTWQVVVGSGRLGSGYLVLRADNRENPGVRLGSRASSFGVQMDIPGVGEDRTGYEEAVRGSKGRLGAEVETRA
uniref:Uncharacterized protein n=1 Tax=Fagus sylvatica TaxID=28930 RepID=A0A2N9GRR0_FAGSY